MESDKKWIYLSYIGATLLLSWVLDQTLRLILSSVVAWVRIPNPMVLGVLPTSSILAVVAMTTFAYHYTRREKVRAFSMEVAQELRKVSWPVRKNAYLSTIVVLVTVIIMAAILGVFDWLCSTAVGLVIRLG